ncbi:hypothetical protein MAR_006705 [Mya arenaria]|uniref:Uncharacterized protein n=1 Tax=Mya arenaria TaxID=6604 RepID=A0ABY7DCY3_MYAAR|nr:hypothetical protein MAR_006705 [Mya arenaria]
MSLRLRLFDDVISGFGHDCEASPVEFEAMLTPRGSGNNAFCRGDNHGQGTPLSIEIPAKPMMRRRTAFDVRRGLFSGKRSADVDLNISPVQAVKKAKDVSCITLKSNEWLTNGIISAVETLEIRNDMIADGYRFLRAQDRMLNNDSYPRLNFPEVYLLQGEYKAFFNKYQVIKDGLRLFDDVISGFGHDCEASPVELEAMLTPRGSGNNAFCRGDNHGQGTPLSCQTNEATAFSK